ncbi:MAG: hypothetical protein WA865_14920 [Spirulinaceae cyanobacterium]
METKSKMDIEELEARYREEIDRLGNQLQNATLEISQIETVILQMGQSIENLSAILEEFIQQQRDKEN